LRDEELYKSVPPKKLKWIVPIGLIALRINYKILKIHNPWPGIKKLDNSSGKKYSIEIL
jgi:hypothetical protein